jgi:hypothetical protein
LYRDVKKIRINLKKTKKKKKSRSCEKEISVKARTVEEEDVQGTRSWTRSADEPQLAVGGEDFSFEIYKIRSAQPSAGDGALTREGAP